MGIILNSKLSGSSIYPFKQHSFKKVLNEDSISEWMKVYNPSATNTSIFHFKDILN
jgi:hypothetical protein